MLALVKYYDEDEWRIHKCKDIKGDPFTGYVGKYHGSCYSLELVFKYTDPTVLEELKYNLRNNIPHVSLSRLKSNQTQIVKEGRLNITHTEFNVDEDKSTASYELDFNNSLESVELVLSRDRGDSNISCSGYIKDIVFDDTTRSEVDENIVSVAGQQNTVGNRSLKEAGIIDSGSGFRIISDICIKEADSVGPIADGDCTEYVDGSKVNLGILEQNVAFGQEFQMGFSDNELALGDIQLENHYFNHLGEEIEIIEPPIECDDQENSGSSKNRKIIKKHSCYYCGKLQSQISRHLLNKHKVEEEVKSALQFMKGSSQRKVVLENLRKKGDASHTNIDKITVGKVRKGKIVSCPHCRGYYSQLNLRNHVRIYCKFATKKLKNNMGISRVLMSDIHPLASQMLRNSVFPHIRNDNYFKIITQDEAMVLLGNRFCQKYLTTSKHHDKMITQHLRLVARIFLGMQNSNRALKEVRDIIDPTQWDLFVLTVKEMAGTKGNGTYKVPSIVHYSCDIIRHLAILLKCEAIKRNDDQWKSLVEKFQYLLSGNQNADLRKAATETRASQQRKKVEVVPTTEEINCLLTTINSEISLYYQILQKGYNFEAWTHLNELILIYMMVFNRKRPGDVERMELAEYNNLCVVEGEFAEKLDAANKVLANYLGRCVTRGKLNQAASILVNRDHMKVIKLLIQYREISNVSTSEYLFADPKQGRYPYLKAGTVLGEFVRKHNLNTISLTATKLRYHLASATARLDKDKQTIISKFMGHEPGVHNKCYQKALIQNDVLTMGGVLMASNGFIPDMFENYIQPVSEITREVTPQWLEKDDDESDTENPPQGENVYKPLNNYETDLSIVIEAGDEDPNCHTPTFNSQESLVSVSFPEESSASRCTTPPSSRFSESHSTYNSSRRLPFSGTAKKTWKTPERPLSSQLSESSPTYNSPRRLPFSNTSKKTWKTPERPLSSQLSESSPTYNSPRRLPFSNTSKKTWTTPEPPLSSQLSESSPTYNSPRRLPFSNTSKKTWTTPEPPLSSQLSESNPTYNSPRRLPFSNTSKKTWTTPERHYIRNKFKRQYRDNTIPRIYECQDIADGDILQDRTPIQIQAWVRADMERKSRPRTQRKNWTTPQNVRCRQYFSAYYKGQTSNKYPSKLELEKAVATIPELKNKTVETLRSHLQHDFQYTRDRNMITLE